MSNEDMILADKVDSAVEYAVNWYELAVTPADRVHIVRAVMEVLGNPEAVRYDDERVQ